MQLAPNRQLKSDFISTKSFKSTKGFALITELISLLVFGLGVLALSSLSERTVTSNSESLQKIHATWLTNSLISRLTMNSVSARNLDYKQDNIDCKSTPATRTDADLAALFCTSVAATSTWAQSKPTDVMGELDWTITCVDSDSSDSISCSKNSEFSININWDSPNGDKITGKNGITYEYYF